MIQASIKKDISLLGPGENLVYRVRTPQCPDRFGFCFIKHIQSNSDFVFEENYQYLAMLVSDATIDKFNTLGLIQ